MLNPDKVHRREGSHWVSAMNFDPEVVSQFDWPKPFLLIDSTLRKMLFTAGALTTISGNYGSGTGLSASSGTLDPREATILRARFGLDGGTEKTLEEVGEKFGVTRERVRQIQNIALKKLRKMIEKMETTKK